MILKMILFSKCMESLTELLYQMIISDFNQNHHSMVNKKIVIYYLHTCVQI